MTGGSRIYDLRTGRDAVDSPADMAEPVAETEEETAPPDEVAPIVDEEEDQPRPSHWPLIAAIGLSVVWLGAMLWLAWPGLRAGPSVVAGILVDRVRRPRDDPRRAGPHPA